MKRKATAVWQGTGLEGKGTLSSPSQFFNQSPYNFQTRFQNEDGTMGTNPEELLAASHAGCFCMALSFQIAGAGYVADELNCEAIVDIGPVDGGFAIGNITLNLKGKVNGMSEEKFVELANAAKVGCPISKALNAVPIDLNITFG